MSNTALTTFGSREVSDLVIVDFNTGKPVLKVDYANTSAAEVTGEIVYAYGGKGHPRRIAFYGERGGTFTVETQITTMQLYALLAGSDITTTGKFIEKKEVTAAAGGSLTMAETISVGTTPTVCASGTLTAIAGSWSTTTFTATTAGDIVANSKYDVYYIKDLTGVQTINVKGSSFPKAVTIYADGVVLSESNDQLPFKMVVYKGVAQNTFNISQANSGDPVSITATFEMLADANSNVIDFILEEAED